MDNEGAHTRARRRFVRLKRVTVVLLVILLVVLGSGFVAETIVSAREMHRYRPPGKLVSVGGYSLYVNCRGTGSPAVVFESGNGGTSLDWASVQPEIAKKTRTCSYDRAGFGWSDAAPVHSLERMRTDLDAVLRETDPKGPYVLVAHSFGGLLALDYASRHPDRVAGLVLVDAADKTVYDDMNAHYPSFIKNGRKFAMVTQVASVLTRFGLTRLVRQPASPKSVVPSVRGEYRAVGYLPKSYRAFTDDLRAFPSYVAAAEDVAPTNVPAVVLTHTDPGQMWAGVPEKQGAERLWQQHQAALADRLHARHEVVPGTGHFIEVLRPDRVIAAIEEVLDKARVTRSQSEPNV